LETAFTVRAVCSDLGLSLIALSIFVLVAARIGQSLSFDNRGVGALITALLFAVGFAIPCTTG
jgi:hypothetical protein